MTSRSGSRRPNLALVEVDDVVENDWLEERAGLGRRPARVQCRLNARHDVRRSQHHVEHVQDHHLTSHVHVFIYIIKSYAKYTVNDKKEKKTKTKNKKEQHAVYIVAK